MTLVSSTNRTTTSSFGAGRIDLALNIVFRRWFHAGFGERWGNKRQTPQCRLACFAMDKIIDEPLDFAELLRRAEEPS